MTLYFDPEFDEGGELAEDIERELSQIGIEPGDDVRIGLTNSGARQLLKLAEAEWARKDGRTP